MPSRLDKGTGQTQYSRTAKFGSTTIPRLVRMAVRRFFCRCCAVTVSCLPRFAQPYRVVCNATIEAFFEGRTARRDVRSWGELLGRYQGASWRGLGPRARGWGGL